MLLRASFFRSELPIGNVLPPIFVAQIAASAKKQTHMRPLTILLLPTHYPSFAFFVNNPNWVRDSYVQFLENQLRKNFNFKGVPIEVYMRAK